MKSSEMVAATDVPPKGSSGVDLGQESNGAPSLEKQPKLSAAELSVEDRVWFPEKR